MLGVKARAGVWHKALGAPASTRAVNYMWMVSKRMEENQYPVYPEQTGEEDRPVLPYAPV